jgi:uncharacterized protein with von Willebrand factor type A (vWA) domain
MNKNQAKIDLIITAIRADLLKPGSRPLTSSELRHRADMRRSMANMIKTAGGQVQEAFK